MHNLLCKIYTWVSHTTLYRGFLDFIQGDLEYRIFRINQFNISTAILHQKVFPQFKNKYAGKDIAVIACGPSLNDYQPIPTAINMGVNYSYRNESTPLDYLFLVDGGVTFSREQMHQFNTYRGKSCIKFYGNMPEQMMNDERFISESDAIEADALRFNFDSFPEMIGHKHRFAYDLSTQALTIPGSSIFAVLQFALWTNPNRIFLVGCDCTNSGHFYSSEKNDDLHTDIMYQAYVDFKRFANSRYPDTKIISVNPVALKGLFTDWHQKDGSLPQ